jgi:hypothetical protein
MISLVLVTTTTTNLDVISGGKGDSTVASPLALDNARIQLEQHRRERKNNRIV